MIHRGRLKEDNYIRIKRDRKKEEETDTYIRVKRGRKKEEIDRYTKN